jgi:hypothetical protein
MKVPLILKEVETRTEDSAEREQITQILEIEENSISKYPVNLLPKFVGSNPAEAVGFFWAKKKIIAMPSVRRGSKAALPPCRRFAACKRTLQ